MVGTTELLLIALLALLLFGGKKIPELMRGLGKGVKEYKKAFNSDDDDTSNDNAKNGKNRQSSREESQVDDDTKQ